MGSVKVTMKSVFAIIFTLIFTILQCILAEDCELTNNCRIVDLNGDDDWIKEPGHYRFIQECIDEASFGDTCLIRPGRYHEEIMIRDKSSIDIRGDSDYESPVIDG